MRTTLIIPAFLLTLASSACATGRYHQVQFAGEVADLPDPVKGRRTVHVVRNTEMKDTLVETRLRSRLETFLLERGFVIAPPDTADLYVLATFGSGVRIVGSATSVHRPAEVRNVRGPDGNVVRRAYIPERIESWRIPELQNSLWLLVLSADARYFRETGMVRNLWRGEAATQGKPETMASAAPYLLAPALRFFGKRTSTVVTMDVREKDAAWHELP